MEIRTRGLQKRITQLVTCGHGYSLKRKWLRIICENVYIHYSYLASVGSVYQKQKRVWEECWIPHQCCYFCFWFCFGCWLVVLIRTCENSKEIARLRNGNRQDPLKKKDCLQLFTFSQVNSPAWDLIKCDLLNSRPVSSSCSLLISEIPTEEWRKCPCRQHPAIATTTETTRTR